MKNLIRFLLVTLACLPAFAQKYPYHEIALGNQNGFAKVLANAQITVCSDAACGSPVTVYNSTGNILTQPFSADVNGNYIFYAFCGQYYTKVAATGFVTKIVPIYIPCAGGGGGGGSVLLQINHVDNGLQTTLDLVSGPNVGLFDDGSGNVSISANGGANLIPDGNFSLFASGTIAPNWTSVGGNTCALSRSTYNNGIPEQTVTCTTGQTGLIESEKIFAPTGNIYTLTQQANDSVLTTGSRYGIKLWDSAGTLLGMCDTGSLNTGFAGLLNFVTGWNFKVPASGDSVCTTYGYPGGNLSILSTFDGTPVTLGSNVTYVSIESGLMNVGAGVVRQLQLEGMYGPQGLGNNSNPFTILASDLTGTALTNGELLIAYPVGINFSYACNAASTRYKDDGNPSAPVDFLVKKNGSTVCTITVGVGGTITAFSGTSSSFSESSGDELQILAPATADASLFNPRITLIVQRQ